MLRQSERKMHRTCLCVFVLVFVTFHLRNVWTNGSSTCWESRRYFICRI